MKLLIGLGNPEEKYKKTRHNVGFMVLDKLAGKVTGRSWSLVNKFKSEAIYLPAVGGDRHSALCIAKPHTSMNESGEAVSKLANYFNIDKGDLWVVHDDLDIKLGEYKIQEGKGPKDHNGLNSIYEKLGYKDFWHIRVGIDSQARQIQNPNDKTQKIPGDVYVLQNFSQEEFEIIDNMIEKVSTELQDKLYKK